MLIGFLTCPGTHPASPVRRDDAYEHDLQVAALRPALQGLGHELVEIDWRSPIAAFAGIPLVLIGTPWDYQDAERAFLDRLDALERAGHTVCNSSAIVRWNARKTYLRDLAKSGVATIPTRWLQTATVADVRSAMTEFSTDTLVAKRQVGAGAEGQSIHRLSSLDPEWRMKQPAMLQPFLPQIEQDGEYSFLFVDAEFSHALRKRPAAGDYRVQSIYGGVEECFDPSPVDLAAAQAVIGALPFGPPLYARIDMVRDTGGKLLVMEAELIEPFLYPAQGPRLGAMLATAIDRRVSKQVQTSS